MLALDPTVFGSRDALMAAAADRVAAALEDGVRQRGAGCAALSGGSTPEPAYALLAQRPLDWGRITFALVDERFVPPSHADSNEGMLRRALAPALAKGATLAAMYAPDRTLEQAAAAVDAAYAPLRFDIALMGMGTDGHTASWFAGAEGLERALDPAATATVAAVRAAGAAGSAERLTLTRAAVLGARRVVLLITGEAKLERLAQACAGTAPAPVAALWGPAGAPEVLYAA